MAQMGTRLDEVSNQINENIVAVKGTLELLDTSVAEDELHQLVLKALERMDTLQRLSDDLILALKNCIDKREARENEKR